jgi:alpha-glucosidase (family GH31 glycosyl hydrolase)
MGSEQKDAYSFSAEGGEMDYYFIGGPKFIDILNQYTSLTGKSPMLPKAGYGLHMGTYSGGTWGFEQYTSDRYVIALARKLREMGIPVDLLWLDSTWRIFGDVGGKGATSFNGGKPLRIQRACLIVCTEWVSKWLVSTGGPGSTTEKALNFWIRHKG